ncbi:hypothetical protein ACROYT_G029635 [Oculina patagonica]
MSEKDNVEKDLKESVPEDEQVPRADSSASSVISRTSSPEQLQDDVFGVEKREVSTSEQLSADIAARGIINPKNKFSGSPPQGIRGMLIAAADIETNNAENTQETDQVKSQRGENVENEQLLDKHVSTGTEENAPVPQDINFFHKDSSTSRPSSASSSSSLADKNKREVCFEDAEGDHLLQKERSFISHTGNTTVEVVSICTQTEWSWLKDMELYQDMTHKSKPDWAERSERKTSREVPKSPSATSHGSVKRRRRKSVAGRRTSVSSDKAQTRDEDTELLPEVEEGHEAKQHFGGEEGSTGRSKSKSSGGVPRSRQSVVSSLPRTPKGEDILFRPPTVEPDSSSSSEEFEDYDLEQEYLLPSIGPPAILQYMKESQNPPLSNEEVQDRQELAQNEMLKTSNFSGPCMFCEQEILPFPTLDELERLTPDQLYCCPQYERLVKFELAQRSDTAHLVDEMIDIKPHPPYGTKAARRAAKERAAERAREREMERQRAAGANPTNFYALTRQMKTITYSLASTKCMEEGWTVRPPSPSSTDTEQIHDPFVIEVNPLQLRKQAFLERFYENKRRFLLLLPDGTGSCYYPSGNVAVMITATEKGKFTYIVYDDEEENESNPSQMLGIFEPSGHGTCYFRNGAVRLVLNPFFGVLLDKNGARKKKWLWHNLKEHVHAPPFQPITFMITKQLSIRCLSQNKTVLTFNHGKHTARFNVGAKLKAVMKAKPPSARDSYEMHLAEVKQFVNIVLDRAQNAMRLPNYPRLDKIPLPLRLQRARDAGKKARLQASTPSSQQEKTVIVN